MATRFYFPDTTAAEVTPVDNGAWIDTNEAVDRKLEREKTDTALAEGTEIDWQTVTTGTERALDRRYVSEPIMAAQTISGYAKMQLLAHRGASDRNERPCIEIYVVTEDGSTVRGTLLAIGKRGSATDLNTSTYRNASWAIQGPANLTPVAIQEGDRLVVAIGYEPIAALGLTCIGRAKYGDPVALADLAENQVDTADAVGWIEFSGDIDFEGNTLTAAAGTFSLSGQAAVLYVRQSLVAEPGRYRLSGQGVRLLSQLVAADGRNTARSVVTPNGARSVVS